MSNSFVRVAADARPRPRVMMITGLALVVGALLAARPARAAYILEQVGLTIVTYDFGSDFNKVNFGPTQFDLSAPIYAVRNPSPMGTGLALGCTVSDYAGFRAGSIALVYGGICSANSKAAIAQTAGAIGILIGNSSGTNDAPAYADGGIPVDIPTLSTNAMTLGELTSNSGTPVVRLAAGDVLPTVLPSLLLEQLAPTGTTYTFGTDFNRAAFGPSVYDVSGSVYAVLNGAGTDLSIGCTASDYAGLTLGSIAFVSRGTCSFNAKTALAQAAGATGVLIGNTVAGDAIGLGNAGIPVDIPTQSTSLDLRNALFPLARDGTLTMRLATGVVGAPAAVPEPASWAMLVLGFGMIGGTSRRARQARLRRT